MATTSAKFALEFIISAGNCHDAPEGRKLLEDIYSDHNHYLVMGKAYEDYATRALVVKQGFIPVFPPKSNRKEPWDYDKGIYRVRNEVERIVRRIKRFRRLFTRYDKLDVVYMGVLMAVMIFDAVLC